MTSSRRLPSDFSRNAAFPLFAIDPVQDRAWVLHFEAADYRRASFLDQRTLGHREISGWEVSRDELDAALDANGSELPVHWLFHIGHCGSTLVSRLLDLIPGVLGLREPLPLLALAQADEACHETWLGPVSRLLGRGFAGDRAVIVKPTSVVTVLAKRLLAATPGRACLLWVDLQTWLASMLRDPELVAAVVATESRRLAGFERIGAADSDAARLARAWLAEQWRWRLLQGVPELAPRLMDIDFAQVLADPAEACGRIARHYGLEPPPDWRVKIADSGLMTRYAKDESQTFDAGTRRRELIDAARAHAPAIAEGVDWAEAALQRLGMPELSARLLPRA